MCTCEYFKDGQNIVSEGTESNAYFVIAGSNPCTQNLPGTAPDMKYGCLQNLEDCVAKETPCDLLLHTHAFTHSFTHSIAN